MKNTELSYFLESLQGQSLLDLSPAPGGGITLHFESKYTSGHTDDLTLTLDIDFDGMYLQIDFAKARPDTIRHLPQ